MSDQTPAPVDRSSGLNGLKTAAQRLSAGRHASPLLMRWILAGPVTLIVTLAIMAGMTAWWPRGAAGLDQIGMPLILSPVIWVCVFIYALLEDRLGRACVVMLLIVLGNGVLLTLR